MLGIKKFYFKLLSLLFQKNVWCAWERNFEKEYELKTEGIHSGTVYYKGLTPDSINVKTDWRTKAVKGKRHQLVFLGKCYKSNFPSKHKDIYIW